MTDPVQNLADPLELAIETREAVAIEAEVSVEVRKAVAMERGAAATEALSQSLNGGVTAQERRTELARIVVALIGGNAEKSWGGAASLVADAAAIQAEIDKRFP